MAVEPHRPHAGIFLQLGFPDNPVIALVGAPDLILGLPVSARDQVDDLVAAPPNIVGCTILSIADGQTYSIAVWSHGELLFGRLSKTIAGIVCHQDQPCTMTRCTAMESPTRVVFNARTSRSIAPEHMRPEHMRFVEHLLHHLREWGVFPAPSKFPSCTQRGSRRSATRKKVSGLTLRRSSDRSCRLLVDGI